jgi:hypothetical protein
MCARWQVNPTVRVTESESTLPVESGVVSTEPDLDGDYVEPESARLYCAISLRHGLDIALAIAGGGK